MSAVLPTEDDVRFFETRGWWVSPPMLDEETLARLRYGIERFDAGETDWRLPVELAKMALEEEPVRQNDYLSLQLTEFRDIVLGSPIAAVAAALARTPLVRLFHDQLVTKPPFDPARPARVGWHTDRAYWSSCSSEQMLTAWIPIEDVTDDQGPLAVWDASHLWPGVEQLHAFADQDLEICEASFRARGLPPEVRTLPMACGQVSFHHCRLVHGGYANLTNRPRHGYAIHLQDASNTFVRVARGGRQGHLNDLLCRRSASGYPDYADPDIFPTLWP